MSVVFKIKEVTSIAINHLYAIDLKPDDVLVNATKPEFEGDYTVVLFAFIKQLKKSPDALGQELGGHIIAANPELFTGFNVIKGFLNLTVSNAFTG
jgi:arginyl-tRNA synthetase